MVVPPRIARIAVDDITRPGDRGDGVRGRLADHLELMPRRKILSRLDEQSLGVTDGNLELMGNWSRSMGRQPPSSGPSSRQMMQARVFEKQAQKLDMQKLYQLDSELHGMRQAWLESQHQALEDWGWAAIVNRPTVHRHPGSGNPADHWRSHSTGLRRAD
jgi:hypothetical protein